ncbi:diguanylate cyclase [Roseovarius autotrophicus]|uniref:diguanylate cyclase n=1 Tax=Roseovarius autotrophicus TaxID=2824121 RepID=UPI0019F4036B|nr:diguanylate cyclase [Roseovarius autotrophicus]MBE0454466.1 diguanylate cyclase [Roseovarius sp.]
MSGTILIVDDLATNRIVLKVKLATAPYRAVQAGAAREALRMAMRDAPDLILVNARLGGQSAEPFVRALRRVDRLAHVPIVLLQSEDDTAERLALLRAGADEVLSKPIPEPLLLARLRNFLRQRMATEELLAQIGSVTGFAETQAALSPLGRVALFGPGRAEMLALRASLADQVPHRLTCLTLDTPPNREPQDVFVIRLAMAQAEEGLRLLADLKAAPGTRHCPVIAMLENDAAPLAVTLLDIGADEVVPARIRPEELAQRIARQMRHKRLKEGLHAHMRSGLEAALRDPLTGAYNRRHALPWLERQIARLTLNRKSLAVMVADLDFFKRINDRHGHVAGDAVLCAVTERLRAHLREGDLLARIGGEEFLIALPDTSRAQAQEVAARLCEAVSATPVIIPGGGAPIPVTLSIGVTVAASRPGLPPPLMQTLLEQADRALYAAKARGRNQARFCARSAA